MIYRRFLGIPSAEYVSNKDAFLRIIDIDTLTWDQKEAVDISGTHNEKRRFEEYGTQMT